MVTAVDQRRGSRSRAARAKMHPAKIARCMPETTSR